MTKELTAKELRDFNKEIKPFIIFDHVECYALCLNEGNKYDEIIREGGILTGNGYDWEDIMQTFIAEEMPEAASSLRYDSEAGMFCVYCNDSARLMKIISLFKEKYDDIKRFKDLISRTEFLKID